jgi:uncharacterized membrane protein
MPVEPIAPEPGRVRIWNIFPDHNSAHEAIIRLEKVGIPTTAINMVFRNEAGNVESTTAERADMTYADTVKSGAFIGGATGTVVGTAVGAVLATAAVFSLPGALLIGPLAGALVGSAAGGALGGAWGQLTASGVSDHVTEEFQKAIANNGVGVIADVPEHLVDEALSALETNAPVDAAP